MTEKVRLLLCHSRRSLMYGHYVYLASVSILLEDNRVCDFSKRLYILLR